MKKQNNKNKYITLEMLERALKGNNKIIINSLSRKIDEKIDDLAVSIQTQFQEIDEEIRERFDGLDSRIKGINLRLDHFAENYVKKPQSTAS
jgi:hypothetical protein